MQLGNQIPIARTPRVILTQAVEKLPKPWNYPFARRGVYEDHDRKVPNLVHWFCNLDFP